MNHHPVTRKRRQRKAKPKWTITQLPVWVVKPAGRAGYVVLTCPRKACGIKLWVNLQDLLQASEYTTRPCTGCFKTNQLPKEVLEL